MEQPKKSHRGRTILLSVLGTIVVLTVIGLAAGPSNTSTTPTRSTTNTTPTNSGTTNTAPAGKVEVKSSRAENDQIVGEVVNNTADPVRFVEVAATTYDAQGAVVDTNSSYAVSDQPLAPGDTAPFKIYFLEPKPFSDYKLGVTWN